MSGHQTDLGIDGARLFTLTAHGDERGSFTEVFRQDWLGPAPQMLQMNLSLSQANVLRGLHFHRRQADYWCVVSGRIFVGLYDLRSGSPTERRPEEVTLGAEEPRQALYIPPGVAHGFYAETDVVLQYLVDTYYTGEDEFGVAWNDPGLGLNWPGSEPILSERDQTNPSLDEVLRDAPAYGAPALERSP